MAPRRKNYPLVPVQGGDYFPPQPRPQTVPDFSHIGHDPANAVRAFNAIASAMPAVSLPSFTVPSLDDWVAGSEKSSYAKIKKNYDAALAKASNQALPAQDRVEAATEAEGWKRQLEGHTLGVKKTNTELTANRETAAVDAANATLSAKGFIPAAKPGAVQSTSLFGETAAPKAPPSDDPQSMFAGVLGGPVTITSGYRDPKHNAAVGGVSGSDHTRLQANGQPMAWDVRPPKGVTPADAAKILAAQGFGTIAEPDRGVVHVSVNPKQVARGALQQTGGPGSGFISLAPSVTKGDPLDVGQVFAVSPQAAMGMIPSPRMLPKVNLPDAPQMAEPDPMPALAMMDKAGMLAPLAEALQVKPRDGSHDAWDRVAALLQGAAQAGAGVSPSAGLGQFLLAAGGGAASGFRTERKEQKAEQDQHEEAVRQAKIVLARAGFEIDKDNFTTGNANLDRAWKSGQAKKEVKFSNDQAMDARSVQEILYNAGITQHNIGALNQVDQSRANVGLQAMQGVAQAGNVANTRQIEVNNRTASGKGQEQATDQELIGLGLDPNVKSPLVDNARQTLAAANAKDVGLAMSGLARELVLSGHYKDVLGDVDAKAVQRAIQLNPKDVEGPAQIISAALSANMSKKPEAVIQLVDELAALGLPSAVVISKKRARAPTTAK